MKVEMEKDIRQFDFARHWRRKIVPLFKEKRAVVQALNLGMLLQHDDYIPGNPPWICSGRGLLNGQRARRVPVAGVGINLGIAGATISAHFCLGAWQRTVSSSQMGLRQQ